MIIKRGIKIRIYPNEDQKVLINKNIGCVRFVYNQTLAKRQEVYKQTKTQLKQNDYLNELKTEYDWLKEVDATSLQQAQRDLHQAFQRFFKKQNDFPKFHSKHNSHQSYRSQFVNNNIQIFKDERLIKIPKVGYIKFAGKIYDEVLEIQNITVSRTKTNKYFISICYETDYTPIENEGCLIGIDVGIKEFYTDSNGNVVHNPKYLEKCEKKLKRLQRKLSKTQKGSHNHEKARIRYARQHEIVYNRRNDFLHKLTNQLIHENQVIVVEDIKVKNLLKNHKLSKSISSASWGRFFELLTYKAELNGNEIIKVGTFFPSSKTCSNCGHLNNDLILKDRSWTCPHCHTEHDRDFNAAKNILNEGKRILNERLST